MVSPALYVAALGRARNCEMLVAATQVNGATRVQRRAIARLLLAAGVAMRSVAQQRVWFPGDDVQSADSATAQLTVASIRFDRDVPLIWRPYFVRSLVDGIADLRRVFPALRLSNLN